MFTKLAQLNINHFNDHPVAHAALCVGYSAVAGIVLNKMLLKIADADTNS